VGTVSMSARTALQSGVSAADLLAFTAPMAAGSAAVVGAKSDVATFIVQLEGWEDDLCDDLEEALDEVRLGLCRQALVLYFSCTSLWSQSIPSPVRMGGTWLARQLWRQYCGMATVT